MRLAAARTTATRRCQGLSNNTVRWCSLVNGGQRFLTSIAVINEANKAFNSSIRAGGAIGLALAADRFAILCDAVKTVLLATVFEQFGDAFQVAHGFKVLLLPK